MLDVFIAERNLFDNRDRQVDHDGIFILKSLDVVSFAIVIML